MPPATCTAALPPLAAEVRRIRALLPQDLTPGPRRTTGAGDRGQRIQVLCRFRGQTLAEEGKCGGWTSWEIDGGSVSSAAQDFSPVGAGAGGLSFSYDRVLGPTSSQAEVYESVEPVVREVLNGVNGAVLCYGQTSAGKTFTMEGRMPDHPDGGDAVDPCGELAGIIPRALATVFNMAYHADEKSGRSFRIHVSMLEIYMERLRDLLSPDSGADLRIVEDNFHRVWVRGAHEVVVGSYEHALQVFQSGQLNRAVAATGMNDRSSRSHSVFVLRAEPTCAQGRSGKLCLVDLAGSECLKKACLRGEDAAAVAANAEIVEEAKAINQSLSTLGLVINRLADRRKPGFDNHIPYRSSKLTRVLQDAIGGSAQTVLVINCSLSSLHASETLSTLRFGARASTVMNAAASSHAGEGSVLLQTLRAARCEIERLRRVGSWPSTLPTDMAGGSGSDQDADAHGGFRLRLSVGRGRGSSGSEDEDGDGRDELPSPIALSPASRRTSRQAAMGPLWGSFPKSHADLVESHRPSAMATSRRTTRTARVSIGGDDGSPNRSVSPLKLSVRPSVASRRASRSVPTSRKISMVSDCHMDCDAVSLLSLSPSSQAASRRVSRHSRRVSGVSRSPAPGSPELGCPETPSPGCTAGVAELDSRGLRRALQSAVNNATLQAPRMFRERTLPPTPAAALVRKDTQLTAARSRCISHWEHPMTQSEIRCRVLLLDSKEIEHLTNLLEEERIKHTQIHRELYDKCEALQANQEWEDIDRHKLVEAAVHSTCGADDSLQKLVEEATSRDGGSPVRGSEVTRLMVQLEDERTQRAEDNVALKKSYQDAQSEVVAKALEDERARHATELSNQEGNHDCAVLEARHERRLREHLERERSKHAAELRDMEAARAEELESERMRHAEELSQMEKRLFAYLAGLHTDFGHMDRDAVSSQAVSRRVSRHSPEAPSLGCATAAAAELNSPGPGGALQSAAKNAAIQAPPRVLERMPPPAATAQLKHKHEQLTDGRRRCIAHWEHPMTRSEIRCRVLLLDNMEIEYLTNLLEDERVKHAKRYQDLCEKWNASQTNQESADIDRHKLVEAAVHSSFGADDILQKVVEEATSKDGRNSPAQASEVTRLMEQLHDERKKHAEEQMTLKKFYQDLQSEVVANALEKERSDHAAALRDMERAQEAQFSARLSLELESERMRHAEELSRMERPVAAYMAGHHADIDGHEVRRVFGVHSASTLEVGEAVAPDGPVDGTSGPRRVESSMPREPRALVPVAQIGPTAKRLAAPRTRAKSQY